MDDDISIEFIEYLINNLSMDELYELYASATEILKESPEAVEYFIKELPEGDTRDYLENLDEKTKIGVITEFWFSSINSIMMEKM